MVVKASKLSVVVSTYNRDGLLRGLVKSLNRQSAMKQEFDVVIVDNSRQKTARKVIFQAKKLYPSLRLKYFYEAKEGISAARNLGAKKAEGKYLAFIDDDAVADREWVKNIIRITKKTNFKIVGGLIKPLYQEKPPEWFKDSYETRDQRRQSGVLGEGKYLSGSNIVIEKELFEKLGGFDSKRGMMSAKLGFGEETEFQLRAREMSVEIFCDRGLVVHHLVTLEKLRLSYRVKRQLVAGREHSQKLGYPLKRKVLLLPYSVLMLWISFVQMFVRDRSRYRFWQNWVVERMESGFFTFGRCF